MAKASITAVPGNGWRTANWIRAAYGLSKTKFYMLRQECLTSKYSSAIKPINQRTTFIQESGWQNFLDDKSRKFKQEHYGI